MNSTFDVMARDGRRSPVLMTRIAPVADVGLDDREVRALED